MISCKERAISGPVIGSHCFRLFYWQNFNSHAMDYENSTLSLILEYRKIWIWHIKYSILNLGQISYFIYFQTKKFELRFIAFLYKGVARENQGGADNVILNKWNKKSLFEFFHDFFRGPAVSESWDVFF